MRVFPRLSKSRLKLFGGSPEPAPSSGKPRVLFVSHEATRTGAPMIILNILRHFSKNCDIQCETILHNGGHIAGDFAKVSKVDCLNLPRKAGDDLKKRVQKVIQREKDNRPVLAICNSMESRFIAEEISQYDIPMLYLVHELPSSYSEQDYESVYQYADRVIFPAKAVRDAANSKTRLPEGKSVIYPQGLLNEKFGTGIDRESARAQIRKELELPESSAVVLGCGTLDLRKGIDHFAAAARETIYQMGSDRPVHFVWLGEGPRWTHSPFHYVKLDLEKSGMTHRVHFVGERANVEPFFMGADCFLMSSRVDPFPCVIHEAMAAGLPIIAFERSGGAVEAIEGGAGVAIPYADYKQVANTIRLLINQPEIAQSMSRISQDRVRQKYCFASYSDQIIELAEQVSRTSMRKIAQSQPNVERRAA
ncbi:MAG: glycosyltransferase [Pirellulaceae bacterium]